jgi:hypothetical protein
MKNYTVNVTQEDIDLGCKQNSVCCPVARAAARAMGELVAEPNAQVDVGVGTITVSVYSVREQFKTAFLPLAAREFICCYDAGDKVYPFSFEIQLAEEPACEL